MREILITMTFVSIAVSAAGQTIESRALVSVARAYQGRDRGPEQTERFSRKVRVGRDGRVSIGNIAGDITVTGGSGDDVSIEAVKRTRGDRNELGRVQIIVDERGGRVDIRTEHERNRFDRDGRNDHVSVDYTISMPSGATLDAKSISGHVKVSNVQGAVRAESISGNVIVAKTPRLELAKTISSDVELTDASAEAELQRRGARDRPPRAIARRRHDQRRRGVEQRDVRSPRHQVGQRRRRVLGRARPKRTLRRELALRNRAAYAVGIDRLRAQREHLQRIHSVRAAADDRRQSRP